MNSYQQLRKILPKNKSRPPVLHPEHTLVRKTLINSPRIYPEAILSKIFFIEAQAGQGKTTLALQWLEQVDTTHTWYQTGKEDRDPIFFFTGILLAIAQIKPFLQSSPLMEMLCNGEMGIPEIHGCIAALFQELTEHKPREDFVFVFDDLQLITASPQSLALFDKLLQTSPFFIHFILISRHPLEIDSLRSDSQHEIIHLTNKDLALSAMETMVLLHDIINIPMKWETVLELHKRTDGWIMGILLASQMFHLEKEELESIPSHHIKEYFQREILTHIPEEHKKTLMKLSLLDEIDPLFARKITGEYDIEKILEDLAHSNFFIHRRGGEKRIFTLHYLFREFLQNMAQQKLSPSTIETIFEEAAEFCLAKGRIAKSLYYYLQAENGEDCENLLQYKGMELLASNRHQTILSILQQVPEEFVKRHLWILLYRALANLDTNPTATLPAL